MEKSTKAAYLKLAKHFYKKRLAGAEITPKAITDALIRCADEYRPAYWRKLRNALELDQREKKFVIAADRIKAAKNPLTVADAPVMIKRKIPAKQYRVKKVKEADHLNLIQHFQVKKDWPVISALSLANLTGCRPAEMKNIKIVAGGIFIKGAKKTDDGSRGLDRTVVFDDKTLSMIKKFVDHIKSEDSATKKDGSAFKSTGMLRIQARIDKAAKALYPRRKAKITLYSYRHQMGSDLKSSGLDRVTIAYLMGHQSTKSVEVYGYKKSASGRALLRPEPASLESARGIIRDNHDNSVRPEKTNARTPKAPRHSNDNDLSF